MIALSGTKVHFVCGDATWKSSGVEWSGLPSTSKSVGWRTKRKRTRSGSKFQFHFLLPRQHHHPRIRRQNPLFSYHLSDFTMPKKQFLKDNKKKSKHAAPVSILALSFLLHDLSLTSHRPQRQQMTTQQVGSIGNRDRSYLTFVTAGVDFEEAGEKWRGGDAAKV